MSKPTTDTASTIKTVDAVITKLCVGDSSHVHLRKLNPTPVDEILDAWFGGSYQCTTTPAVQEDILHHGYVNVRIWGDTTVNPPHILYVEPL